MKTIVKISTVALLGLGLVGCSDNKSLVKDSTLSRYSDSLTVGKAFDTWKQCDDVEWEEFKTERDEELVEYTCVSSGDLVRKLSKIDFSDTISDKEFDEIKGSLDYSPFASMLPQNQKAEKYVYGKVEDIVYNVQFKISADGESYEKGYSGIVVNWEDGTKTTYDSSNFIASIYKNEEYNQVTPLAYNHSRK